MMMMMMMMIMIMMMMNFRLPSVAHKPRNNGATAITSLTPLHNNLAYRYGPNPGVKYRR